MAEDKDECTRWNQLLTMLLLIVIAFFSDGVMGSEVAVMHYGHFGGLSLTCQRNELILMESEVLGYSTNRGCNPQPLCSVPYTLAKWYCRGKSTCGGMQVERRPLHKRTCGSEFTNCLRVAYQCVPMSKLTDICSDTIYEAVDGYISSPDFPDMYPPDKNCTCSLTQVTNEHVQIDTAFFLLKSSRPCHDWLRVTVDNEGETTRCGYIPEQKRYTGRSVNINFVSDGHDTEMGFWLRFTGTGGSPVKIRCGRYVNTDDTVTPSSKPPRPKTTRRLYKTRFTTKYTRTRMSTVTARPSYTGQRDEDFTKTTRQPNNRAGRYTSTKHSQPVTEKPDDHKPKGKMEGKKGEEALDSDEGNEEYIPHSVEEERGVIEMKDEDEKGEYIYEEDGASSEEVTMADSEDFLKPLEPSKELEIIDEEEDVLEDKKSVVDQFTPPALDERIRTEDNTEDDMIDMDNDRTVKGSPIKPNNKDKMAGKSNQNHPGTGRDGFDVLPDTDVKSVWTSPEYVDLDADYVDSENIIDMSDPQGALYTKPSTQEPVSKHTTHDDPHDQTESPMVHFVHKDETVSEKDEIINSKIENSKENYQSEDVNSPMGEEISIDLNSDVGTFDDYELESYNSEPEISNSETVLLNGNDPNFDSDAEISVLGGTLRGGSQEKSNYDKPREDEDVRVDDSSSAGVEYDEAVLTGDLIDASDSGFMINEEEVRISDSSDLGSDGKEYPSEDQDSTGRLLLAPTDFPQTIKDSENLAQSQKPLPSFQPSTTTSGYAQSITDLNKADDYEEKEADATPFDWRLTLSKAGYDYDDKATTKDPFVKTTTPDEMLHYVHSGKPFTDKNSIATGEFLPVGDIISLIDEKDITTTVTTPRTTTPPPEIFTLLGGLTPVIPLNTIGKGFKPLLIPARKVTTPIPTTSSPTRRSYPTGPQDLASLFEETPWRSFGVNTSWIPPMILGDDMVVPQHIPVTQPPYNMPEAIRSTSNNKDLMWVLILIAVVLWVVFMALLALLIYHRRKRLACLRGNQPRHDPQSAMSKNMFVPPLSAPITPGFRRPCQHNTATQTGASRIASAMSWNSSSSGPLVHDQRPPNPSPTTWSYNDDSSRSITPASPTPSDIRAASTQTLLPSTHRNSCAVQTDISGTLRRFNASMKARTSDPSLRRHAPLPPLPMLQNSLLEMSPQDGLKHVPPITYAHTILRNIPGNSPTRGSIHNPPYAESTTDLTTNDLNQNASAWVTLDPLSPQYDKAHIYGSLPVDDGRGRADTPQTRPRAKTLNINTRPSQKKKVHRLSGLPPPPPPPDFFFGPETPKSRKSSINSTIRDQTYSTIRPRARPRASSTSSKSTIPGVNPECSTADLLTTKWDKAQEDEPEAVFAAPPKQFQCNAGRAAAPVLSFPPPPPPTPPPLPSRRHSPGFDEASDEDNERTHPVGCEASHTQRDNTPTHLKRGISTPNVQDLQPESDNLLTCNQDMLKGESAPQLNRGESPEEKLKGLVPQQAFFFNDKVQPELRRILSKRRFGSEPVQV